MLASICNEKGRALRESGDFEKAVEAFSSAIIEDPQNHIAFHNRAESLFQLRQYREALIDCERLIALNPLMPEAFFLKANILRETNDPISAIRMYEKALTIRPSYAHAMSNLASTLMDLLRDDEAEIWFRRAIEKDQFYAQAHVNYAQLLLRNGRFKEGWREYSWRSISSPKPISKRWTGLENISGKVVLIQAEQGLGDTIQFSRYLKNVSDQGAQVIFQVPPTLLKLMRTIQGVHEVITDQSEYQQFDYWCPLLDLPRIFSTTLSSIPSSDPYIVSDPIKLKIIKRRINAGARKIGLAWSGNPNHKNDSRRSVPAHLLVSAIPEGYELYALQTEIRDTDRSALEPYGPIKFLPDVLSDFSGTAALAAIMEVIVSVDTSPLHLVSAMGKPCIGLISYSADWRWMLGRSDSPWYRSLMLLRQGAYGKWDNVLERLSDGISRLAG